MLALPLAAKYCPFYYWLIPLFSSVQIIYLLDHLLDVYYKKDTILSPRHAYIKRHTKKVIFAIAVLFFINSYMCLHVINTSLLLAGKCLGLAVFCYFINTKTKWFYKEILTALIYALGICMMPFIATIFTCNFGKVLYSYFAIFIIASINLICNNLFYWNDDTANQEHSLSINIGKPKSKKILMVLFALLVPLFLVCFVFNDLFLQKYIGSIVLIGLVHFVVYRNTSNTFIQLNKRRINEISFALPGIIYLLLG